MVIKLVLSMSMLKNPFSVLICSNIFPTLFSIGFRVSGLKLRSLIQLELNFCKVIDADLVWFLYMYLSVWPIPLVESAVCSSVFLFLTSFIKRYQVPEDMQNYMWSFTSILLITESDIRLKPYCFCYYTSVLHLEIKKGETFRSCFIIWDYFNYSVFLLLFVCLFPYKVWIVFQFL